MKNWIRKALVVCIGVGLVGCEWQGGGDGSSWNSRYNFVNFSGNYRGQGGGGYLVSQYTTTPVSSGDTGSGTSYAPVTGEADGTAPAAQLVINGKLNFGPIKPGSVTVLFGSVGEFRDDGAGGLSGSYEVSGEAKTGTGTIDYDTGIWTIVLTQFYPLQSAQAIVVSYAYAVGSSGAATVTSTPGSTKVSIYAFNVFQEGEKLRIVDNNGSVYEGSFGSIRTTGGVDQDTTFPTYSNGDQITAQFEANGRSAANIAIQMVGNFSATIAGVTSSGDGATVSMRLTDRRILGTWIESGGVTGDINGQSVPVTVSTATETTTAE